jgi:ABC-type transport system involved in multi-copper enzyme maturation permease subunit
MNGTNVTTMGSRPAVRERPRFDGLSARMVSAELLKVRRRRGLVACSAILTVGAALAVFGITALLHAQNPAKYGPAGGVAHLSAAMAWVSILSSVAAILIGATAGAGDLQAGVFRDLVSTGRSRVAFFAGRIPGGLALLWPLVAFAWVIACAASVAFAGNLTTPAISLMVAGGVWVLLVTASMYLLAVGVASVTGSRTAAVGLVLAWQFVLSPLLLQIAGLGVIRQGIQMAALGRFIPAGLQAGSSDPVSSTMPVTIAALVIAAWAIIPLAAGAWRTKTRDA